MTPTLNGLVVACLAAVSCAVAAPQNPQELLLQTRASLADEQVERSARQARFAADEQAQRVKLATARKALQEESQELSKLRAAFAANQQRLTSLRAQLSEQAGGIQDLRAQFQQIGGETQGLFKDSLITSQLPERRAQLKRILQLDAFPTPQVLRELWLLLQEEMTETGRIARYSAPVAAQDGSSHKLPVTRIGGFTAVAGDHFLRYLPEFGTLETVEPQPAAGQRKLAAAFTAGTSGVRPMVLDPTRGAVLGLLAKVPSLWERILQGRAIGFVILGLGALGLLLALERLTSLHLEARRVQRQKSADAPDERNTLGRVLLAHQAHRQLTPEALELKLDEVVLQNTPRLQRGLGTIRLFAVLTPMLGLLGTVTGLIETFHSITLYGAGDARLMAGGISQALVTTALGLSTAIPLLLLHSLLNTKSRRLLAVLDEHCAGIIANHDWGLKEARRAA